LAGLPAENLGLKDRGLLKPEYFADIVVFDPAKIRDHATFAEPHQYATGVRHVLVNGTLAIQDGKATEALPGKALRHESKKP
jgi:N-acyl-D-amino-acid deacylase